MKDFLLLDEMLDKQKIHLNKAYEEGYKEGYKNGYDKGYVEAKTAKTLEQEPKTGHWIDIDEGFSPCECSECESVEFIKSKYCPNCGARMFEPQERSGEV